MSGGFHGFEGSYLGDAARLAPDAVMECKICWSVYDPARGCDTWQVPPGTPFAALPAHWRCPTCDGAREQFMVVHGAAASGPVRADAAPPAVPAGPAPAALLAARLEAAFREIHVGRMRGIPLLNEALAVRAVGFRAHDGHLLGVLVTPWFMNLILAPGVDDDWSALVSGAKELIAFPSGLYEFTAVHRAVQVPGADLPPYKACALFSPMFEFSTMQQAIDTAEATLRGLLDPTLHPDHVAPPPAKPAGSVESAAPAAPASPLGRRGLLFGAREGAARSHA